LLVALWYVAMLYIVSVVLLYIKPHFYN